MSDANLQPDLFQPKPVAQPVFCPPTRASFEFRGFVGERCASNVEHWLLSAPYANPGLLQMFRDRDRKPRPDLVPWAGEFSGKYLISAVQALRMTQDERLRPMIAGFVRDLVATQDRDGYLGSHPREERLIGKSVEGHALWDLWGHYHVMLGLLLWFQETGDQQAFDACIKAADMICAKFLDAGLPFGSAGAEEMNMAVSHIFCLLYQMTGQSRYLRLVRQIEREWETPPAGDYVRTALAGKEFFQTPKPRWESLHDIQAIAELHFITGETKYRQAFEHIWWSILQGDRHNSGGFSSGEAAVGNPYDPRAIETCCTIAWIALSVDMLRLTGHPLVADEIELATFNAVLGAQHPSGRWWTYNTPMDGVRKASAHDIVFQARPGSPELNCCAVNGPRGLGMLSEWAVMLAEDGVVVNYYGPCTIALHLPSGNSLKLTQATNYPLYGETALRIELDRPERFCLRCRIPAWSERSRVLVNGKKIEGVAPGSYLRLDRQWANHDVLQLSLDMSPHFWVGEREVAGKASIYRGPILLAYDQRYNMIDPEEVPMLDAHSLRLELVKYEGWPPPWMLWRWATEGGDLFLCDFASAGAAGTPYRSWLPLGGVAPRAFSKEQPVWHVR